MSGLIIGFYGYQRSGKTLMAYLTAEKYYKKGIRVYTNMDVEGYIHLDSLSDIPFDYEPKIVLLDEAYYFMDARNWKNNTEASIFFNTIGKQNILLLLTSIHPDMIELRLRQQQNYIYIVKSDENFIHYKMIDVIRRQEKVFHLRKLPELFKKLRYDTKQVPDFVDCNISDFIKKVKAEKLKETKQPKILL